MFKVLLFTLLTCAACADEFVTVEAVQKCMAQCASIEQTACETGCKIAYSLTLAPKEYAHNPTCYDSCKSMFHNSETQSACNFGCDKFGGSDDNSNVSPLVSFLQNCRSRIVDGFRRMREFMQSRLGTFQDSSNADPIIRTHVRLVIISNPGSDVKPDDSEGNTIHSGANPPFDPKINEDSALETMHEKQLSERISRFSWEFACRLHRILSNPLKLMLALTLAVLFFLLLTHVVLHIRRRRNRSHGYQYAPLPTYSEAIEIKTAVDSKDSEVTKHSEKQEEFLKV